MYQYKFPHKDKGPVNGKYLLTGDEVKAKEENDLINFINQPPIDMANVSYFESLKRDYSELYNKLTNEKHPESVETKAEEPSLTDKAKTNQSDIF